MPAKLNVGFVLSLLFMVVCETDLRAQSTPEEVPGPSSGTLNLILANQNGFVLATDSRQSGNGPFKCADQKTARKAPGTKIYYCDDSQKLFKTSKKSALMIAGFSFAKRGTPLDLTVASVLRRKFGPGGHTYLEQDVGSGEMRIRDDRDSGGTVFPNGVIPDSMWCRVKLSEALTAITSLYDFLPPENMAFEATFAGINEDEKVVVRRQIYHGTWVASGPLNAMAPQYEVQETPLLPVRSFVRNAIGISSVADAIFGGHYRSHDPVILRFYSKLNNQAALDAMSLSEMVEMAHSILRETRKFSYVVGGPDEIGIFPAKGQPQLLMPSLPSEKKFATHFAPREGLLYTKEHPEGQLFGPNRMSIFLEDYQHPLDEVIPQFFLGCEFKDIPVVLDDNYFVRGAFGGVTFKYTGKPFLAQRNTYTDCTVEVPENVAPTGSEVFSHCRLVRLPQVTWEKGSVGEPLRWQSSGHQIFLPIH